MANIVKRLKELVAKAKKLREIDKTAIERAKRYTEAAKRAIHIR